MDKIDPSVITKERKKTSNEFTKFKSAIAKLLGHPSSLYNTIVPVNDVEKMERFRRGLEYFRKMYVPVSVTGTTGVTGSTIVKAKIHSALRLAAPHLVDVNLAIIKLTEMDVKPLTDGNARTLNAETKVGLVLRDLVVLPGASPCFSITIDHFVSDELPMSANLFLSRYDPVQRAEELGHTEQVSKRTPEMIESKSPLPKFDSMRTLKLEQYAAGIEQSKEIVKQVQARDGKYSYIIQENIGTVCFADILLRLNRFSVKDQLRMGLDLSDADKLEKKFGDLMDMSFSSGTVLSILVQIIHTLHVARDECGFVHYDLHAGNVMVKRIHNPLVANSVWAFKLPKSAKMINVDGMFVQRRVKSVVRRVDGNNPFEVVDIDVLPSNENWILIPPEKHQGLLVKIIDFGRSRVDQWWQGPNADSEKRYISCNNAAHDFVPLKPENVDYFRDLRTLAWTIILANNMPDLTDHDDKMLFDLLLQIIDLERLVYTIKQVQYVLLNASREVADTNPPINKDFLAYSGYEVPPTSQEIIQNDILSSRFIDNLNKEPQILFARHFEAIFITNETNKMTGWRFYENLMWHCHYPTERHLVDYKIGVNVMEYFASLCASKDVTVMALDLSKCEEKVRKVLLNGGTRYMGVLSSEQPYVTSATAQFAPSKAVIWDVTCRVCRSPLLAASKPFCSQICEKIYLGKYPIYSAMNILYDAMFYDVNGKRTSAISQDVRSDVGADSCSSSKCASCVGGRLVGGRRRCSSTVAKSVGDEIDARLTLPFCSICAKVLTDTTHRCPMCDFLVCCTEAELVASMPLHKLICPAFHFAILSPAS